MLDKNKEGIIITIMLIIIVGLWSLENQIMATFAVTTLNFYWDE